MAVCQKGWELEACGGVGGWVRDQEPSCDSATRHASHTNCAHLFRATPTYHFSWVLITDNVFLVVLVPVLHSASVGVWLTFWRRLYFAGGVSTVQRWDGDSVKVQCWLGQALKACVIWIQSTFCPKLWLANENVNVILLFFLLKHSLCFHFSYCHAYTVPNYNGEKIKCTATAEFNCELELRICNM